MAANVVEVDPNDNLQTQYATKYKAFLAALSDTDLEDEATHIADDYDLAALKGSDFYKDMALRDLLACYPEMERRGLSTQGYPR